MKNVLLVLALLAALGTGGWRGWQWYQANQAQDNAKARQAAAEVRARAQQQSALSAPAAAAPAHAGAAPAPADSAAARQAIEAALKLKKVTSILLGDPALVIIDKQEYAAGDEFPLPGGKRLQITAINDAGVRLTWHGMDFHLDAPAAPDLAASRKGK